MKKVMDFGNHITAYGRIIKMNDTCGFVCLYVYNYQFLVTVNIPSLLTFYVIIVARYFFSNISFKQNCLHQFYLIAL